MKHWWLIIVLACAFNACAKTIHNWNFGPFFTYRVLQDSSTQATSTFWAFRPFYSDITTTGNRPSTERDVLWPLGTWHNSNGQTWWRAAIAYGESKTTTETDYNWNIFPFWFCGQTRDGEDYWGLFPFWGHHPHLLLLDNWDFAFWPLWHTYTVKGVRSHAVCWPFITWRDEPRAGWGVWPFFGSANLRESDHSYFLWPLLTWANYDEDRDTAGEGSSWMLWPFVANVGRVREIQWQFLPPFFSYAETPQTRRWRCPWPLVDVELGARRNRVSVWPLYESIEGFSYREHRKEEHTYRYLWWLVEDTELDSTDTHEERFNFFPFYTREVHTSRRGSKETFTRVWPFWSRSEKNGVSKVKVLDLNPIRHSPAIDRNFAPFWTFYEAINDGKGKTRHSMFWHLVTWKTYHRE